MLCCKLPSGAHRDPLPQAWPLALAAESSRRRAPSACNANLTPQTEICDGLDNDCDGAVDDGDPGEAARRLDDQASELALLGEALQRDAGVIRRMGLSLPARVKAQGRAARAGEMLARSPRLREGTGFVVAVESTDAGLRACLLGASGENISCAQVSAKPKERDEELAVRLAEEAHRVMFAPKVSLDEADRRSLDGTTTASREASREQMDKLMGDIAAER